MEFDHFPELMPKNTVLIIFSQHISIMYQYHELWRMFSCLVIVFTIMFIRLHEISK